MSTGKQEVKKLSITVASGTGTGTIAAEWALARWIRVIPPSESNTYTLSLKDGDGHLILQRSPVTGTFSEQFPISIGILRTVEITSASADGTYVFKADTH